jgi:glutamine amidotransferase
MIAVMNYVIGNITAVENMLKRLVLPCRVTANASEVEQAKRIILLGNGAFSACIRNLRSSGLMPILEQQVLKNSVPWPIVGAQMLGSGIVKSVAAGFGWLDMHVERFLLLSNTRILHI